MDNPAAWHPDPAGKHDHRWWDGQRWTEHVADAGVASVDPLPAAPDAGRMGENAAAADRGADTPSEPGTTGTDDTDAGTAAGTDAGDADATRQLDAATRPAADAGATAEQPVWGQQPSQQPQPPSWSHQQQPWGGAPTGPAPSWSQAGPGPGQPSGSNGLAIGALITGILSIPLLIVFGLGAVLGVVALVLGIVALRRTSRGAASGRGMAIGGIVTGAISIVVGIFIVIFLFTFGFGIVEEMDACMEETGGDQAECQRRLERELTDRFLDG